MAHQVKPTGQLRFALADNGRRAALQIPITVDDEPNMLVVGLAASEIDGIIDGLTRLRGELTPKR